MIIHTTQKNNFTESKSTKSRTLFCIRVLTLCVLMLSGLSITLNAQTPVMHIFSLSPDWNGKSFCGAGPGYHPDRITAPSVSYSGKGVNDPVYEYYWEQKKNDGNWEILESSKDSKFIPSLDPKVLYNDKPGGPSMNYSFRLRIIDHANGDQSATSDIYTITILSGMMASHKVIKTSNGYSIDLDVKGGFPEKKYNWTSIQSSSIFPEASTHVEDPAKLSEGVFEVGIQDGGCPEITYKVTISN